MCFHIENIDSKTLITIGKFTILWHQFEKEYCDNHFSVRKFSDVINSKNLYVEPNKMTNLWNIVNSRYIDRNKPYGREDDSDEKKQLEKEINNFTNSCGSPTLLPTICVIYRIRCNLCHGLKDIKDLNNQRDLFEAINDIFLNIKMRNEDK